MLKFSCTAKDGNRLEKVKRLIEYALSFNLNEVCEPEDSPSKVKIEASQSVDHSEEDNRYNGDNNSVAKGGVVTNAPTGNTSSSVVDLITTSSVFPIDNKLESRDWLRAGGIWLTREKQV